MQAPPLPQITTTMGFPIYTLPISMVLTDYTQTTVLETSPGHLTETASLTEPEAIREVLSLQTLTETVTLISTFQTQGIPTGFTEILAPAASPG